MPEFRSLASLLKPTLPPDAPADEVQPPVLAEPVLAASENIGREARLFYASVRERLDAAVDELRERIARDVLARELQLASCDVEQIVARVTATFERHGPLRVRVHSSDAARAAGCGLPVYEDDTLQPGDAVLELRDASVDARLHARVRDVLG